MKAKFDCAVSPTVDGRATMPQRTSLTKKLIKEHINLQVSHYNREHAPNHRYLEPNLSISDMSPDFTNNYQKISYELYRQVFESEKITFGEPSQDECKICLTYNLLVKESGDHDEACEKCLMGKRSSGESAMSIRKWLRLRWSLILVARVLPVYKKHDGVQ